MSALFNKISNVKIFLVVVSVSSICVIVFLRLLIVTGSEVSNILDASVLFLAVALGLMVIRNIKVEKKQREELLRLTQELKAMDTKKNEFINMAAHELRAPLTAVKGFISMVIAGDSGPIGVKTKEFLIDTAVSTQRMIRLVNNMLNVNRIEDGRMMYSLGEFKLSEAVKQIYSEFQVEALQKKLNFNLNIATNVSDLVYADRDRIDEIMVNFLSNAVKYTSSGSVNIHLYNPTPHVVKLEVSDTGPGITKLEQRKLFQKFYRVEAKVGKTIGTGLGLYICKLLVKKFRGNLGVVSGVGKGSTFWFELPVKSNFRV